MDKPPLALLVIDMQKEYESDGKLPVNHLDRVKSNVSLLIKQARRSRNTILIHARHISLDPDDTDFIAGTKGVEFMDDFIPLKNENVITKHFASAFSELRLKEILKEKSIKDVIVCGLTSIICCDTTCRAGCENGFNMKYISDAISEFDLSNTTGDTAHTYVDEVQALMFSDVINTKEALGLIEMVDLAGLEPATSRM